MTHRRRPSRSLESIPLRAMRTPIRWLCSHRRRSGTSYALSACSRWVWNGRCGIRVLRGNGRPSASARGCRECSPQRVRRVGAVRSRRTGRASWNPAYPGPRAMGLQVRPLFGADVSGVEHCPGEVDQALAVEQLEHLLVQPSPRPPHATRSGTGGAPWTSTPRSTGAWPARRSR